MNIIETQNLIRRFGRTDAVNDLTLQVPEGSVFALLGPNGSGKSTTIKIIMNLIKPTSGCARVLGMDSRKLKPQELSQIGYVSENQQLPLWMTVRQFLDFCRPFYPQWDSALEKTLLEKFELPEERKLKDLSRGMLMKASLLSSLAYHPRLLVLDEPFSGLDPLVRDEVVQGLLEVSNLGAWTVFISSHDIEEIERLADHIALIEHGRINLIEPTDSLLRRFRRVEVNFGEGFAKPKELPASWMTLEVTGTRGTFVDSAFDFECSDATYRTHFPDAKAIAHPMTLREIFISIARNNRRLPKGAAA